MSKNKSCVLLSLNSHSETQQGRMLTVGNKCSSWIWRVGAKSMGLITHWLFLSTRVPKMEPSWIRRPNLYFSGFPRECTLSARISVAHWMQGKQWLQGKRHFPQRPKYYTLADQSMCQWILSSLLWIYASGFSPVRWVIWHIMLKVPRVHATGREHQRHSVSSNKSIWVFWHKVPPNVPCNTKMDWNQVANWKCITRFFPLLLAHHQYFWS